MKQDIKKKNKNLIFVSLCLSSIATMYLISGSGIFSVAVFSEYDAMNLFSLVFTLEALARSIALPIGGKIGIIIGRKKIYLVGVVLYMIALLLCSTTSSIILFLVFKAFVGFSWGLFFSNTLTIVSDIYDKSVSPKYLGYLQAVNNATIIISPVLTGFFVDNYDWRVNFYIGLPLLVIAWILIFFNLPSYGSWPNTETSKALDMPGIFATVFAVVPISFFLALGGVSFSWISVLSISLIIMTIAGIGFLILAEKRAVSPLYPIHLFSNKIYMTMFGATFLYSLLQAATYYIPLFIQTELGYPSTVSGIIQMPSYVLSVVFSALCGLYIARHGISRSLVNSYWIFAFIGSMIFFTFIFGTNIIIVAIGAAFLGCVMGMNQVIPVAYVQTKIEKDEIAGGIAFITFGQGLATSLGSAICGVLLIHGTDVILASTLVYSILMMSILLIGFKRK